ncbi:MAG: phosphate ABC transporter permease PstA [Alphaproteobacteria bacterium]|nr:phosphate ABC transporter permease PstA [Alphaproteobacteria bacterium]
MSSAAKQHHQRRLRAEKRFACYGKCALGFALLCLVLLLGSIASRGIPGFMQTEIRLPVPLDVALLEMDEDEALDEMSPTRYNAFLRAALLAKFPDGDQRDLSKLLGSSAGLTLKNAVDGDTGLIGTTQSFVLPASSLAGLFLKHPDSLELSGSQRSALKILQAEGAIVRSFDSGFFSRADSRSPENAGFAGAMAGSFFTMLICLLAAFPIGVMSAVYLEEFAPKSRWSQLIEVNVNNLAAVPSIVYGLLGLAVYINFMHLPRSAPLVGGLTLALMVFPVIIIATRTALESVPPSIRQAALALGASPLQVVWHHTLPLALPGIMTGTILGMARAIGETAPLLMIGMVAFVADIPGGFTSAATVMPVQIYLWASSPEAGFVEKTATAILVLLLLLLLMNALAIYLRKKFEVRW